jgi:CheY-like chemotaxis protein
MATILVIDDDADTRALLEETLRSAGYETVLAADGKEGLDQFRTKPMDLVITDLFMPNQEGLETIRQLHRHFPTVPIIAISGNPLATAMLSVAIKVGAVAVLQKPFSPNEGLLAVEKALQSKTASA